MKSQEDIGATAMDPINGGMSFKNRMDQLPKGMPKEVLIGKGQSGSAEPIVRPSIEARRRIQQANQQMTFGASSPLNNTGDRFERRNPPPAQQAACPPGQACGTNPLLKFGRDVAKAVKERLYTLS